MKKNQAGGEEGLKSHTSLPLALTTSAKSIRDQAVGGMKNVGDAVRSFNVGDLGRDVLKHGLPVPLKVPGVPASAPLLP